MTPDQEAAYLRRLADEIGRDTRLGRIASIVVAAADWITRQETP